MPPDRKLDASTFISAGKSRAIYAANFFIFSIRKNNLKKIKKRLDKDVAILYASVIKKKGGKKG